VKPALFSANAEGACPNGNGPAQADAAAARRRRELAAARAGARFYSVLDRDEGVWMTYVVVAASVLLVAIGSAVVRWFRSAPRHPRRRRSPGFEWP
jgi:hypothetical protein